MRHYIHVVSMCARDGKSSICCTQCGAEENGADRVSRTTDRVRTLTGKEIELDIDRDFKVRADRALAGTFRAAQQVLSELVLANKSTRT